MSQTAFGAIITCLALLVLALIAMILLGPGHNILVEGANVIFVMLNESRVGLGL